MDPPELVDARRVREPSDEREKRVEVVASKVTEVLEKRSRPANDPARPTLPMRSKSTSGIAARATWRREREIRIIVGYLGEGMTCTRPLKNVGGQETAAKERKGCEGQLNGRLCTRLTVVVVVDAEGEAVARKNVVVNRQRYDHVIIPRSTITVPTNSARSAPTFSIQYSIAIYLGRHEYIIMILLRHNRGHIYILPNANCER
jgi:hypothetical protein